MSHDVYRTSIRSHPFSKGIMEVSLPHSWKSPTLDKYDGNTEPDGHVAIYITQVSLYTSDDAILYRVFLTTLKGAYLIWSK